MKSTEIPQGSLASYIEQSRGFSLLHPDREQALARAWRDSHDEAALRELVGSHLRLVIKLARGFARYGLPVEDLISQGNIGLMQAAHKFDPDRGFRFSTYAVWWIRASIQEYILHSWSLVKIGTTAAQKRLFFNLRRMKAQLEQLEQGDLSPKTVSAIAEELGVAEAEVVEMNRRMAGRESSLNAVTEDGAEWGDFLVDERPSQESLIAEAEEKAQRQGRLRQALETLDSREREIVIQRHLREDPQTLEQLSLRFKVSRERIRQLEMRAVNKLRKSVRDASAATTEPQRIPMAFAA